MDGPRKRSAADLHGETPGAVDVSRLLRAISASYAALSPAGSCERRRRVVLRFDREHELVSSLVSAHRDLWPAASPTRAVRVERGYGRGVADFVVLDFDPVAVDVRRQSEIPPVANLAEATVLAAVRTRGAVTFDQVVRRAPDFSVRHLRSIVGHLEETGHLRRNRLDEIRAVTRPLVRRAIAVEAKLADWRGGMLQASRYRSFADRCYLALPETAARRLVSQRTLLDGLDVGVISVGDRVRILAAAPNRAPDEPAIRCWAEEAELAELLGSHRRLVQPFPSRFVSPVPVPLTGSVR